MALRQYPELVAVKMERVVTVVEILDQDVDCGCAGRLIGELCVGVKKGGVDAICDGGTVGGRVDKSVQDRRSGVHVKGAVVQVTSTQSPVADLERRTQVDEVVGGGWRCDWDDGL